MATDDDRSASASSETPLIGREAELHEVRTRLSSLEGPIQVVGAPRIGKTALLRTLCQNRSCRLVDVSDLDTPKILELVDDETPAAFDNFDASLAPSVTAAALVEYGAPCVISSRVQFLPEAKTVRVERLGIKPATKLLREFASPATLDENLDSVAKAVHCIPGALIVAAERLDDVSVIQLLAEIELGVFARALDPEEWGVAFGHHSESWRDALVASAVFDDAFDVEVFEVVCAQSKAVLDELSRASLLRDLGNDRFEMDWPVREAVRLQAPPGLDDRRNVALHFVERSESDDYTVRPSALELAQVERAYEFGLVWDLELAARAAVVLARSFVQSGRLSWTRQALERVLSCREKKVDDQLTIWLLLNLGECQRHAGLYSESLKTFHKALVLRPSPETKLLGGIHQNLGLIYGYLEKFARAHEHLDRAECAFERVGANENVQIVKGNRAVNLWHEGKPMAAVHLLEQILEEGTPDVAVRHNVGLMWLNIGNMEKARDHLERCLDSDDAPDGFPVSSGTLSNVHMSALTHLFTADILAGNEDAAIERIHEIEQPGSARSVRPNNSFTTLLNGIAYELRFGELSDALVKAHQLRELNEATSQWEAVLLVDAINALLDRPPDKPTPHQPSVDSRYDPRMAHRDLCIDFALARRNRDQAAMRMILWSTERVEQECFDALSRIFLKDLCERVEEELESRVILVVGPSLSWAQVEQHEPVDLRRSSTTRKLLRTLVERHESQPGSTCSSEELFEAAWPGEVWTGSARTRFHTAIHRVRERVLGDLLETVDEGYRLVPRSKVERDLLKWEDLDSNDTHP